MRAFRPMVPRRAIVPIAASLLAAGTVSFPLRNVYAEASEPPLKKPIYDDDLPGRLRPETSPNSSSSTVSTNPSEPSITPTPTDRLAHQIRKTRLFLHAHAVAAEDKLNELMSSFLDLETSFTKTIASLAPPKESGEQIMPGIIYVLVASMAGSIISRNRNILVRTAVPVAVGIGAGWILLPITTRNVADLMWKFEEKAPVISQNHLRIRRGVEDVWRRARETGESTLKAIDETVQDGRETVEEWVKKGK